MPGLLVTPALTPPASNPTAAGLLRRATPEWATTITSAIDAVTTTVPLATTGGLSTDSAVTIVIDPGVAGKEEVIIGFPEGLNLVNSVRSVEGNTIAHDANAVVQMFSTAIDQNSLIDFLRVEHNVDGTHKKAALQLIAVPTGTISQFGAAAAPAGYLLCNGASVLRTDYAALFAVIASTYGSVDGTHFTLPDFRGLVPVGLKAADANFGALAATGGEKTHVLTTAEMPSHTHTYVAPGATNESSGATGNSVFKNPNGAAATGSAGSDGAHNNLQPFLTVNFIIKT